MSHNVFSVSSRLNRVAISLLGVALSATIVNAQDFAIDGVNYSVVDAAAKTVATKAGSSATAPGTQISATEITIPSMVTYEGVDYTVTAIGNFSFAGSTTLSAVELPNTITTIGDQAFKNCSALESVTFPSALVKIGNQSFGDCKSLTAIDLPSTLTTIDIGAFLRCESLKTLDMPAGVTFVGRSAFNSCKGLEKVTISSSLTAIPEYCFTNCFALADVTIPESVTKIGEQAFYANALTKVVVPNSVKEMAAQVFMQCAKLEEVKLSESLTTIPKSTFSSCSGLKSVVIPDAVTLIDEFAFNGCESLVSVEFGKKVTTLAKNAFSGAKSLTEIVFPESLQSIGANAFTNAEKIERVVFNEGLVTIGNNAFQQCTSLKAIELPNTVREIQASAFLKCTGLEYVRLNGSLSEIGAGAFTGDNSIATVEYFTDSPKEFASIGLPQTATLYGLLSAKSHYESMAPWNTFETPIWCGLSLSHENFNLEESKIEHKLEMNLVSIPGETYDISWQSSDPYVAIVDETGLVKATNNGTSQITCTAVGDKGNTFVATSGVEVSGLKPAAIDATLADGDELNDIYGSNMGRVNIYDLQGVMVMRGASAEEIATLPAGIYVVKGKKLYVRK